MTLPDNNDRDDRRSRLSRFVDFCSSKGWTIRGLTRLAGDASNRTYYRLHRNNGPSRVIALYPEPFESERPPFLAATELFRELGVRIPEITEIIPELGICLQEDLGDHLLQDELEECDADEKEAWYRRAIDIVVAIQERATGLDGSRYEAFSLAFDEEKLSSELEFFLRHFVEGFRAARIDEGQRNEIVEHFRELARSLSSYPRVLCHRDYHSRNLIVKDGALVVIDYQDARMGPCSYDMVSLLRDSYVRNSSSLVSRMRDYYEEVSKRSLGEEWDPAALQRNLKALGTFGYQIGHRNNDVYRRYVRYTLEMVRRNLSRNERWRDLKTLLGAHLEEIY